MELNTLPRDAPSSVVCVVTDYQTAKREKSAGNLLRQIQPNVGWIQRFDRGTIRNHSVSSGNPGTQYLRNLIGSSTAVRFQGETLSDVSSGRSLSASEQTATDLLTVDPFGWTRIPVEPLRRSAIERKQWYCVRAGIGPVSSCDYAPRKDGRCRIVNRDETVASLRSALRLVAFKSFADVICSSRPFLAKSWALQDLNPRQLGPKPSTLSRLS